MIGGMKPGAIVILHLVRPAEKYWGVLDSLDQPGITLRGINLSSFDDWVGDLAREDVPTIGLNTVFFPLHRVERMFLDEPMGRAESMSQLFERRLGSTVEAYLGIEDLD